MNQLKLHIYITTTMIQENLQTKSKNFLFLNQK